MNAAFRLKSKRSCFTNLPSCPECNSSKTWKAGNRYVQGQKIQRYLCRDCGFRFTDPSFNKKVFKDCINKVQQTENRQILVSLTEDSKNLTRTKTKNVLRENHKYTTVIKQFCWYMQKREYSKTTIRTRAFHLNKLVKLKADLDDPESVETVFALSEWSKGYKKAYVITYTAYCKWRKIDWEPIKISVPTKIVQLPKIEDVKCLISGLGLQCGTMVHLTFETGARIGEACKIKRKDVNITKNTIAINSPEKNGNSRNIEVTPELISKLQKLPKRKDGYLFNPKPSSHNVNFFQQRKRLAKKLQKPELLDIHFHLLRHLRATLELYKKGTHFRDVQHMLGHRSSLSTDRYTHYRPQTPTKWEIKRVTTIEEEDRLILENWEFFRFDSVHQQAIYRRAKS